MRMRSGPCEDREGPSGSRQMRSKLSPKEVCKTYERALTALEGARAACKDAASGTKLILVEGMCGLELISGLRILSIGNVEGDLDQGHRTACLETAVQVEFVSLAGMEIPLEGLGRPPTEALHVVFKDTIISGKLCPGEGCDRSSI